MFSNANVHSYRAPFEWVDPALTSVILPELIQEKATAHPDRPMLNWQGEDWMTYGEFFASMMQVAGGLRRLGVSKGDTVLIMMRNSIELLLAWFGANALGAIEVPVNIHDRGRFLSHVIEDSTATTIVLDRDFIPQLQAVVDEIPTLKNVVVRGDVSDISIASHFNVLSYSELAGANAVDEIADLTIRDLMAILYTSGTTGPAKGIMMTYGHAAISATNLIETMQIRENDHYYVCMPLFHSNAQIIQIMPVVMVGARVTIALEFSASSWLDDIRSAGATLTNTLGVMTEFVYRQPSRPDDADNPLRVVQTIPLPAAIAHEFERRFDVTCIEGYGLTDLAMISMRRLADPLKPGSAGPLLRGFEVMVADPITDEALPPNQIGEIMARPLLPFRFMSGYWNNDTATRAAWRNLWFHTGDAGWFDDDGFLYFHDRIKDSIRVKGENVSSSQVESVLFDHPAVSDCAAIAVPAEYGEDNIKVCLVLKEGADFDYEELIRFCVDRMPYFAVPRYIELVAELPKTPTDKVRKVVLREQGITAATWDRVEAGIDVRV